VKYKFRKFWSQSIGKNIKNYFSLQKINIYTPIDRSRRAKLKNICFDLFPYKNSKNHRLIIEFDL
jgi:hypothetical protein